MPSSASYAGCRSSQAPQQTEWLPVPLLALATLLFLAVASIVGLSLSALAFSDTAGLAKPGYGIAQSFVMFASILSLLHVWLHIFASRKDEVLYFDPPIPSFRHQLHAWTAIVIRIAVAMWASATIGVVVLIYREREDSSTVLLKADMFACATGLLFGCVVLGVVQFANRPFTLPWISPARFEADTSSTGDFDDKTSGITRESTGTNEALRVSPAERSKTPSKATSGNTSRSTSSSGSRARKMMLTRRYILEGPTPTALSPLKPQNSSNSGSSSRPPISSQGANANLEDELVPSTTESESFFAASTADSPEQRAKSGPFVTERPVTPEAIVNVRSQGSTSPQRPPSIAVVSAVQRGLGDSPSKFRLKRKSVARPVGLPQNSGDSGFISREPDSGGFVAPSPCPPPPPPAAYYVPGAWVSKAHPDEETVWG
ncbi:hypothetical protein C8A03DRAFT_15243 [Achaetomium macrosporum]|uniref:Uncharacterized protein n=1 Tax=Achaetomium macrosporum TaxID=79813 RepID=A0AAN7HB20_9PEZI|nr:hypothetical protein C8A03DRAFT_15243 [Achaetomium macrosporum]